jgi:cbb3-type cytochrome oxidase cytochrome c subunit
VNYGPLIFLAAFLGMAGSWLGFVFAPQVQLGSLQATNKVGALTYPVDRPGLAKAGLDVYRANGCAYCHSQQIDQTGTEFEVLLGNAGTNLANVEAALTKLQSAGLSADPAKILATLPATVLRTVDRTLADNALKSLTSAGAKAALGVNPLGLDIARGWGRRRTVAEDFLFDKTVMPGAQRIGPDLANAGLRLPDPNWQLRHLYSPRVEVKGSTMPAYPFLFEKRKIEGAPSSDALALPAPVAPPAGYEIVPTPDAKALVAYLLSLRADAALFSTPLAVAALPVTTTTNAPGDLATNAAAPVSPAK